MFQSGVFPKFKNWIQSRFRRADGKAERPLSKVKGLVVAMASQPGKPLGTIRMTVEAVALEEVRCKAQELLPEGTLLNLELVLGKQAVQIPATVDWVNISGFGHTLNLRLRHTRDSRLQWREFVGRLEMQQLLSH